MRLITEEYERQKMRWPSSGRHILAQFDEETIVVYQAYCPEIGHYVTQHGYFGGPFGYNRMSWIKPNFLWMMYRCGWATKNSQEVVLAVRIKRSGFETILREAVSSKYEPSLYSDVTVYKSALSHSSVRLQWDPDHNPYGHPVERRAIQLGLRNGVLKKYGREWIVDVEDISSFCNEQYSHVASGTLSRLVTPREDVYPIADLKLRSTLLMNGTDSSA